MYVLKDTVRIKLYFTLLSKSSETKFRIIQISTDKHVLCIVIGSGATTRSLLLVRLTDMKITGV